MRDILNRNWREYSQLSHHPKKMLTTQLDPGEFILFRIIQNTILIPEYEFENVVCKMSTFCLCLIALTHWGQVTHICIDRLTMIKSPRYTGGDFMFLYRFVRSRCCRRSRRRRRPQVLDHAITFEQLFGFLSVLARLLALTYRLTD